MSRTAAALLRSAPTTARAAQRISLAGKSSAARAGLSLPSRQNTSAFHSSPIPLAPRSQTNTISVDPRILDRTSGFLPAENIDRLIEWQTGLWERLAAEVRNNPGLSDVKRRWDEQGLDMTSLLNQTARDPALTLAFNYASALINNSYFLESINASDPQLMPTYVQDNAAALKEKAEAYAEGIMGGGWLWLVRTGNNIHDIDIVPTFGSGTLLITQRSQLGREDVPLFGTPYSSSYTPAPVTPRAPSPAPTRTPSPSAESESTAAPAAPIPRPANQASQRQQNEPGRSPIYPVPLAVLNLHEMAYLGSKYGVWDKKKYAGDWFDNLDWSRVGNRGR